MQVDALLDPVGGGVFLNELNRLEQLLFASDKADAKERLGRDPLLDELPRTHAATPPPRCTGCAAPLR